MASTLKAPIILFISMLALLPSCGDRRESARLLEIADAISVKPDSALAMLDSVDTLTLNAADLHYFKLLSIKAADKAYLTHTSDSLIRQVIAYHEENPDTLLPEVYYYGGRVYSDLGDAPQALDYYQRALDLTDGDSAALNLRGNILSNMGQLMNKVYLYDQAIAHLKESAEIDSILGDLSGLHYDAQLIGNIFLHKQEKDSALLYYNKAIDAAKGLSQIELNTCRLLIINCQSDTIKFSNKIRQFIYSIISDESNLNRRLALSVGAYFYQKNEMIDSAVYCANELIAIKSTGSRYNGYAALADIYKKNLKNPVKLYKALTNYSNYLDTIHGQTSSDAAIYQNSYYNYSLRERENEMLLEDKHRQETSMIIVISISLLVCTAFIFSAYAYRQKKISLRLAERQLDQLLEENEQLKRDNVSTDDEKELLIQEIQRRIEQTTTETNDIKQLPSQLLKSSIYRELKTLASVKSYAKQHHWEQLCEIIDELYPQFKSNLLLLLGTMSDQEYRVCMLTRCGFTPTNIQFLTCKSKGGISSSRFRMSQRAFGEKTTITYWDAVVRIL